MNPVRVCWSKANALGVGFMPESSLRHDTAWTSFRLRFARSTNPTPTARELVISFPKAF